MTLIRLTAVAAALAVTGGAGTMLFTLVAGPDPWWQGYVSEAGTTGRPYAGAYRWGLMTLAAGVALLSVVRASLPDRAGPPAGTRRRPADLLAGTGRFRGWLGRLLDGTVTVWALAAAAVFAVVAAAVPCSDGCPLPPYEPTTVADVVHAAASVAGLVVLAAAMATMWFSAEGRAVRRLTATAVLLIVPLGAVLAVTMLAVGRGSAGAVLERLVLVIAVVWLVGVALLSTRAAAADRSRRGQPPSSPLSRGRF